MDYIYEKITRHIKNIIPSSAMRFMQPAYHFFVAYAAALWYWFPSRGLVVIGVTGSKGKTTVVELLDHIFTAAGMPVASVSSLRFRIGDRETLNDLKMTMPGKFFLQRFLHDAKKAGCRYVILEVTSEGITQSRHRFIRFNAAIMTNVEPEHIESHGSFEKYLRAKLDLFWRMGRDAVAVINYDDPQHERFYAATAAHKVFYGKEEISMANRSWKIRSQMTDDGIECEVQPIKGSLANAAQGHTIFSPLRGQFNIYNVLAAVAGALVQHVPLEKIVSGIGTVHGIPGRLEFIQKEPFAAVVDYAHTPNSLKNVYAFLRESQKQKAESKKLICVLGSAGGGRDTWKRQEFGKIAAEFCDEIILTNEDPYDENPLGILKDIESGFSQITNHKSQITKKIIDRREAIRTAIQSAKLGDTVIITGKGAEPWIMGAHGEKIPWDDRVVVHEELAHHA